MKTTKLLKTLLLTAFLITSSSINLFAQCEGVYFKTAYRKVVNQPAVLYPENAAMPERFKDLTGDGIVDFIGTGIEEGNKTRKLYIFPSDGAGGFGATIEINLPSPMSVLDGSRNYFKVADFNNDNLNDIFVIYATPTPSMQVFKNIGGGSFTPLAQTTLNYGEYFVGVADMNNDHIADIITYLNSTSDGNYRPGAADGSFGSRVILINYGFRFPGDFDGDGDTDFAVIFSGDGGNNDLRTYNNQGNGVFALSGNLLNFVYETRLTAVRDFNNDGRPDLLGTQDGGRFVVALNQGNGNYTQTAYQTGYYSVGLMYVDDFNGDGFLDIAVPKDGNSGTVFTSRLMSRYTIYTNNGSGGFTSREYNVPFRGVPAGDLDGDGKTDLVSFNNLNFSPGNDASRRLFNQTQISVTKNVCKKPGATKIVDFDGDTAGDKVLFRPNDGRWNVKTSGIFLFPYTYNYSLGVDGDIPQPGDFDGDGKTDLATFRPSSGVWSIRKSSVNTDISIQFGTNGDKPVAADFDGDDTTDIAVFRPSNGVWYVYYTGTGQFSATQFGIEEDIPVQEDFDGDGKTDLAVFRPSTGAWYYLKSSTGTFTGIYWGMAGDVPMPADYDGDGKADVTVFRPLEGNWYIQKSSDLQYGIFRFGTRGDMAQSSDWDGDGIFDLGLYRPFTATWYNSLTSTQDSFGGAGEFPTSSLIKP